MLELKNLSVGYQKINHKINFILENINWSLDEGEIIAIIGENGSGKSTLAKAIMNLATYISGEIFFNGEKITHIPTAKIHEYGIGYFMQGGRVFPSMTVEENLVFTGQYLTKRQIYNRIEEVNSYFEFGENSGKTKSEHLLKENYEDNFNLLDKTFLDTKASILSGGEKHKLALAMVLMDRPKFLILDEPTAGLMPAAVKSLYSALYKIKQEEVKNIMLIEQNVYEAVLFSDRCVKIEDNKTLKEKASKNLNTHEKIDEFFFGKII